VRILPPASFRPALCRTASAGAVRQEPVLDPAAFRTGRDLAAWIGRISKRGNKQLRTLLIVGATSILKQARRGVHLPSWIISLMRRRPFKVVAVALANKMARSIWALLVKGGTYQAPAIMGRA